MPDEIVAAGPFDYGSLDAETRDAVLLAAEDVRRILKRTARDIIDIGENLARAKRCLGHGRFGAWLAAEFDWSTDTAENFMNVSAKFRTFRNLDFAPSALYALSKPSVPEAARQEAVESASNGERITHSKAKRIVEKHKPEPKPSGKSRVNGVLADDPPDVAKARAAGRIAPEVVVEVTEPEKAEPEVEPSEAPAQTDEEWLATLPLREELAAGYPLKTFDEDAILFRDLEPHRLTFRRHATRLLNACRRKGEYAHIVKHFLGKPGPAKWHRCPAPENGGCGGSGQLELIGQCTRCHGKGYWI